jgi:hypothetical protein
VPLLLSVVGPIVPPLVPPAVNDQAARGEVVAERVLRLEREYVRRRHVSAETMIDCAVTAFPGDRDGGGGRRGDTIDGRAEGRGHPGDAGGASL